MEYAKNTKPVKRVLINDITPKAVREEIQKARSNTEFKTMSDRGFARGMADWIVGINLTRTYTYAYRAKVGYTTLRVGRVMMPIFKSLLWKEIYKMRILKA